MAWGPGWAAWGGREARPPLPGAVREEAAAAPEAGGEETAADRVAGLGSRLSRGGSGAGEKERPGSAITGADRH